MFKFIGKTIAGVVLTKDAQAAVGKAVSGKGGASKAVAKAAAPIKSSGTAARAKSVAAMQSHARGSVTPERQALIQHALKVRAAKKSIVGELSDEARANLVGITLIGLMHADEEQNQTAPRSLPTVRKR